MQKEFKVKVNRKDFPIDSGALTVVAKKKQKQIAKVRTKTQNPRSLVSPA